MVATIINHLNFVQILANLKKDLCGTTDTGCVFASVARRKLCFYRGPRKTRGSKSMFLLGIPVKVPARRRTYRLAPGSAPVDPHVGARASAHQRRRAHQRAPAQHQGQEYNQKADYVLVEDGSSLPFRDQPITLTDQNRSVQPSILACPSCNNL